MATINTNMSANIAANSMVRNERTMTSTMERLSTGLRINSAKDDAAGLAISSKMTSQIRGLDQAVRNANDAISMIQVAEGAMKEVTNMFQRMRELAVQAISDSNTNADRGALNNEYKQLSAEVARIAENTQWNGTNILDGARTNSVFQIGANANQTIAVNFGDLSTNNTVTLRRRTLRSHWNLVVAVVRQGDVKSWKVHDTLMPPWTIDPMGRQCAVYSYCNRWQGLQCRTAAATVSRLAASTGNYLTIVDCGIHDPISMCR